MRVIDKEKYFLKKEEMLNFIFENRNRYQGDGLNFIAGTIIADYFLDCPNISIPVVVGQIFSKFGVYEEGYDPYLEFSKLLEKYSFLKGNICEVAAGMYPRLAEINTPKVKLNKGTLTVYDPNILFSDINNITIVKDKFTRKTNIDQFDTLYALYPCDASIPIVEKAFEEDKNLLLAFCECDHSTKEHPKWMGEYWAEDFCMDYRERYGEEAEIIQWPSSMGNPLPIMLRESTKQKVKKGR